MKRFLNQFVSLPFDDAAAQIFGEIRADLAKKGTPIGPYDLQIAAIAIANQVWQQRIVVVKIRLLVKWVAPRFKFEKPHTYLCSLTIQHSSKDEKGQRCIPLAFFADFSTGLSPVHQADSTGFEPATSALTGPHANRYTTSPC